MNCEKISYHPTIWRTCRVLKNPRRLACLRVVIEQPGVTVGEVSQEVKLPINQASINLRLLQSRGLVTCERISRWAHYSPVADPLVDHAAAFLDALVVEIASARSDLSGITTKLPAFTHARRLTLLAMLSRLAQPVTAESLVEMTHISLPAVWRHLKVLETAGMIYAEKSGWSLLPERGRSPLVKTLLQVL